MQSILSRKGVSLLAAERNRGVHKALKDQPLAWFAPRS